MVVPRCDVACKRELTVNLCLGYYGLCLLCLKVLNSGMVIGTFKNLKAIQWNPSFFGYNGFARWPSLFAPWKDGSSLTCDFGLGAAHAKRFHPSHLY